MELLYGIKQAGFLKTKSILIIVSILLPQLMEAGLLKMKGCLKKALILILGLRILILIISSTLLPQLMEKE